MFSKNKNKKLLWSLVPIIKPEYCKVSIKYGKQAKRFWTIRSSELWFISIVRLKYLYFFQWKSKKSIALEINKKLLWSLVPIIKPNIVKLALNMRSKPNFIYIYIYIYMPHLYFKFWTMLWSLVPIMKPEYCEVSIKYDKQAKLFWTIRSRELWFISIVRWKYLYFFLWK